MSCKRLNLINHVFGRLKVISYAGSKYGKPAWLCRCICGNEKIIGGNSLRAGRTTSCGCYRQEKLSKIKRNNLLGKKFGRLRVIKSCGVKDQRVYWLCKCDCGNEKVIIGKSLTSGLTTSCGCYHKEVVSKMFKGRTDYYGENNPNYRSDKTDEERQDDRAWPGYRKWRNRVLDRDSHICQFCGEINEPQAHHIEGYSNNPDLRIILSNGICLCKEHHKLFHRVYGIKYSNRVQLDQFLAGGL